MRISTYPEMSKLDDGMGKLEVANILSTLSIDSKFIILMNGTGYKIGT